MDPGELYRFLLHRGDRQVADALTRSLRGNRQARQYADGRLRSLPRGPARYSPPAIRVLTNLLKRTGAVNPPRLRSNGDEGGR